ncbi:hypothetical protein Y032_0853g2697 [Ancylostoma ceylanicum]|uniref:ShKT domain-containing protein n=1 Tax=Ancylostoma ceylanicum TaxID=53326 RepID=A0A016WCV1_9BILA|nr:hypothetical protein Y032_0853g2697 [Ancylostoma ceylanicum]
MIYISQQFCNSLDFYDQMTEQCASTCNRCPSSGNNGTTCTDFAHDCTARIGLCNNPNYDGLMHRACAKTCNKCGGCYDASSKCKSWAAHGFCTSPEYDRNMRLRHCAKTCRLC